MTGLPWQFSYGASADLDNSELQTDVMRFMAILAFCLVAIFAIVQTMPLEARQLSQPAEDSPSPEFDIPSSAALMEAVLAPATEPDRLRPAKPVTGTSRQAVIARSRPTADKPGEYTSLTAVRSPEPARQLQLAVPKPDEPVPQHEVPSSFAPAPELPDTIPEPAAATGLSLAFESDAVLRSLVERNRIGLFATDGERFFSMSVPENRIVFSVDSAPAQYHEMVYRTVPQEVTRAFESQQLTSARDVVWGVTLPSSTTSQLQRFVQTRFSGSLVITADARLALARSD